MSSRQTIRLSDELISECHLRMIESIKLIDVSKAINKSVLDIQKTYDIAVAESRQTLSLLQDLEFELGDRVLEVGAGYGLASICLAMMGFEVVALEPGGIGFEENRLASIAFAESCEVLLSHISESVETFDFSQTEKFRLIVSNNVLEHIPDVDRALLNLNQALSTDGVMVHSCANYSFPFEPHFGIPLLPFFPRYTSKMLPQSIVASGLWKSLNFIKYSQVKRNSRRGKMSCIFRKGTMSKSIKRLRLDQDFRTPCCNLTSSPFEAAVSVVANDDIASEEMCHSNGLHYLFPWTRRIGQCSEMGETSLVPSSSRLSIG